MELRYLIILLCLTSSLFAQIPDKPSEISSYVIADNDGNTLSDISYIDVSDSEIDGLVQPYRFLFYVKSGKLNVVDMWDCNKTSQNFKCTTIEGPSFGSSNILGITSVKTVIGDNAQIRTYAIESGSSEVKGIALDFKKKEFSNLGSPEYSASGSPKGIIKSSDELYVIVYRSDSIYILNSQLNQFQGKITSKDLGIGEIYSVAAYSDSTSIVLFVTYNQNSQNSLDIFKIQNTRVTSLLTNPIKVGKNPKVVIKKDGKKVYIINDYEKNNTTVNPLIVLSGTPSTTYIISKSYTLDDIIGKIVKDLGYSIDQIESVNVKNLYLAQKSNNDILYLIATVSGASVSISGIAGLYIKNDKIDQDFLQISIKGENNNLVYFDGQLAYLTNDKKINIKTDNPIINITTPLSKTKFVTDDEESGTFTFSSDTEGTYNVEIYHINDPTNKKTIASGSFPKNGGLATIEITSKDFTSSEGIHEILISVKSGTNIGRRVLTAILDNCPPSITPIKIVGGDKSVRVEWYALEEEDIKEYRIFIKEGKTFTSEDLFQEEETSNQESSEISYQVNESSEESSGGETEESSGGETEESSGIYIPFNLSPHYYLSKSNDITKGCYTIDDFKEEEFNITLEEIEATSSDEEIYPADNERKIGMYIVEHPQKEETTTTTTTTTETTGTTTKSYYDFDKFGKKTQKFSLRMSQIGNEELKNGTYYSVIILAVDTNGNLSTFSLEDVVTAMPAPTLGASDLSGDNGGCGIYKNFNYKIIGLIFFIIIQIIIFISRDYLYKNGLK